MAARPELHERRARLVARSAELRQALMRDTGAVEAKLHWIEPIADLVGQFRRHKIVALIGVSNVLFGKRGRLVAIAASLLLTWWKRRGARRAARAA